ncbi:MAG TPA: glycosyltransferase, partial [archaeon]|nr:glycosyltransferase [archaeon]
LLASVKEGFAYTLLEASLAQLPLIATRVGGNPELVSNLNNGILIEPMLPGEIINAISHFILHPKDKIRFGENARKKVMEDFSITAMLEQTKHAYLS